MNTVNAIIDSLVCLLYRYRMCDRFPNIQTISYDDRVIRYITIHDECIVFLESGTDYDEPIIGIQDPNSLEYIMLANSILEVSHVISSTIDLVCIDGMNLVLKGSSIVEQIRNLLYEYDRMTTKLTERWLYSQTLM